MARLNELRQDIYSMLELVDNEEVLEKIHLATTQILADVNPMCEVSEATSYRIKTVSTLIGITDPKKLEYFYFFIMAKLGLSEE